MTPAVEPCSGMILLPMATAAFCFRILSQPSAQRARLCCCGTRRRGSMQPGFKELGAGGWFPGSAAGYAVGRWGMTLWRVAGDGERCGGRRSAAVASKREWMWWRSGTCRSVGPWDISTEIQWHFWQNNHEKQGVNWYTGSFTDAEAREPGLHMLLQHAEFALEDQKTVGRNWPKASTSFGLLLSGTYKPV
jgi:hypothetical protein